MGVWGRSADASHEVQRNELVAEIRRNGMADPRVLHAFSSVPRHFFVPTAQRSLAYDDRALPLIEGQTISQPTMIAIMLEALASEPEDRVLEIGAGCGYAAALLSYLAREVHAVEIRPSLAELAKSALAAAGIGNVTIHVGDGSLGLPAFAPFDRILVSAGARRVPPALIGQLAEGGRIAIPVGEHSTQILRVGERRGGAVRWRDSVPCLFVPLVEGADEL